MKILPSLFVFILSFTVAVSSVNATEKNIENLKVENGKITFYGKEVGDFRIVKSSNVNIAMNDAKEIKVYGKGNDKVMKFVTEEREIYLPVKNISFFTIRANGYIYIYTK